MKSSYLYKEYRRYPRIDSILQPNQFAQDNSAKTPEKYEQMISEYHVLLSWQIESSKGFAEDKAALFFRIKIMEAVADISDKFNRIAISS